VYLVGARVRVKARVRVRVREVGTSNQLMLAATREVYW
jgi:hypothetical protein